MSKKLMLLGVFFSVLLTSCAQKSTPEKTSAIDPSVSPFKVMNVCFTEKIDKDAKQQAYAEFAPPYSPETKIYLIYKIPLTDIGGAISGTMELELAYSDKKSRGIHRQLTGQPDSNRVTDRIFKMANGDNGVYGWDCGKLGSKKDKKYMPGVKIYLLEDSKEIRDKIVSQGVANKSMIYVTMGDLYKEGQETNTNLLTVSNHQGLLPEEWKSCDSDKENCITFKASWEVENESAGKAMLALKQLKSDSAK